MADVKHPGVLLIVRLKSSLSDDVMQQRYKERMPDFQALPGLIQKYYFHDPETDEWGGFYLWDSQESLQQYLASDLRKTIPEIYQIVGTARVDKFDVMDVLRP